MIKLYNETKTPWSISSQGSALLITKDRRYDRSGEFKRRTIKAITYNNLLPEEKVKEINSLTEMKTPQDVFDKNTEVIFSRKDLTTIITSSNKHTKDIYLISLNLQGRKIIGVSDCMVLEYLLLGGEFSLIAAVRPNSIFRIYLLNKENTRKEIYEFNTDSEGRTSLKVKSKENNPESVKTDKVFKPKKFRPAIVTHLVLTHETKKEAIENKIENGDNTIMLYNDETLNEIVNTVSRNNYRAVTLFEACDKTIEYAKKKFDTVYIMNETGIINKVKI